MVKGLCYCANRLRHAKGRIPQQTYTSFPLGKTSKWRKANVFGAHTDPPTAWRSSSRRLRSTIHHSKTLEYRLREQPHHNNRIAMSQSVLARTPVWTGGWRLGSNTPEWGSGGKKGKKRERKIGNGAPRMKTQ